jgi:uncharacterized protein YndB with AHSA1/START domain
MFGGLKWLKAMQLTTIRMWKTKSLQLHVSSTRRVKWWGPKGFEVGNAKLDFRPGGFFHYSMRAPEGFEMWGKFVYHEIEGPEKIVFVNSFSDQDGNIVRAPFSPTIPLEIRNIITFTENEGKTTVSLSSSPIHATEEERNTFKGMFESMKQGFGGTFDQLADYLTKV